MKYCLAVGLEGPIEFNNKPAYAGPMCGVHPEFSPAWPRYFPTLATQ